MERVSHLGASAEIEVGLSVGSNGDRESTHRSPILGGSVGAVSAGDPWEAMASSLWVLCVRHVRSDIM